MSEFTISVIKSIDGAEGYRITIGAMYVPQPDMQGDKPMMRGTAPRMLWGELRDVLDRFGEAIQAGEVGFDDE